MVATSQFTISVINDGQDGAPGATGPQGVSVVKVVPEYRISDSSSGLVPADGTPGIDSQYIWSETKPEIPSGKYLWTRERTDLSDNTPSAYSNAHCDIVISNLVFDVNENAQAITSKISQDQLSTAISNYDSSTVSTIRNSVSQMTQNLTGITSRVETVESTYATKAEVGSNNLYVMADQVPGYLHQSSGAIIAQDSLGKEYTSAFIPVNKGDRITIQSWCTPLDGQGEVRTGYSWLAYQFFSDDDPVTPVGDRIDKWGYSSGSGVETTTEGQEHLTYSTFIPEVTNVKYIRVSYRSYEDGYAMVEKSTTPSEYIINPRDLQDYTDIQVTSAKSEIKQTTDAIELSVSSKVGNNEVISKINQSPEQIKISASQVDIEGAVTFSSLDTTLQNRITTGLGMKVNQSSFSGNVDNGECFLHGYTNGVAANVNGYVYWNDVKRIIPKTMINPNKVVPYYTTIYIVLRLSSASATTGELYMVWYDSDWKYAIIPTPTAIGGTWTWDEATDIVLGQFVEPSSEGAIVDAYLYNPPRNASHIKTTGGNSYQYSKNAVDWVGTNGSSVITAKDIISNWATDATSATTTIEGGLIRSHTITANHLATDAIISNGYTADASSVYSTVGTFLDLANGNIKSPTFAVDNTNGMAYIDGTINARYLFVGDNSKLLNSSDGLLTSSEGMLAAITNDYIIFDGDIISIKTSNFSIDTSGNVFMSGKVEAQSGSIGGWTIDENNIHYGTNVGEANSVYLVAGGTSSAYNIGGSDLISGWVITAGDSFGVTNSGAIYATVGEIAGWILNETSLTSGTWGEPNSVMLCTGATDSKSIGGSDSISGWVITAGSTFGVTNTGQMYSTGGQIGGWSISNDSIYMGDTGMSSNGDKYAFWAGETNGVNGGITSDALFRVGHNGHLIASEAQISGSITATSGSIGGFTVTNTDTSSDLGFNWTATISGTEYLYWCGLRQKGGAASKTANSIRMFEITRKPTGGNWGSQFYIGSDGYLFSTAGRIGGWDVSSSAIRKDYTYDGKTGYTTIYSIPYTAGNTVPWNPMFGVYYDSAWRFYVRSNGELYSSNIRATAGTLGGWTLTSTQITATGNSKITGIQVPSHGIWSFAAGATDANNWATAPFRVKHNGELYSTSGYIGGFKITANSISGGNITISSNEITAGAIMSIQNSSTSAQFYANGISIYDLSSSSLRTFISNSGVHHQDTSGHYSTMIAGFDSGIECSNSNGNVYKFMLNDNNNGGVYNVTNSKWGFLYNYNSDIAAIYAQTCSVRIGVGNTSGTKTFMPRAADGGKSDGVVYCGASDCRWHTVYSKNGTSTSSDERLKKIYRHLGDDHKKLFMELKPIEYSFIDDLDKKHFGLGAQTTEATMNMLGFGSEYNIVEHSFYDEADTYGKFDTYNMNYIEALMLAVPVVQDHEKEIVKLKDKIKELENKLSQLTGLL